MRRDAGSQSGFSLVEVIVAMSIFVVIMLITTSAFDRITRGAAVESKTATSNIEGIVGLEMLRRDLEHAGYGLPWSLAVTPASVFPERPGSAADEVQGIDSTVFNETLPRAVDALHYATGSPFARASYLVVKSSVVSVAPTARKWTYVNYSTNLGTGENESFYRRWNVPDDFVVGDRVVVLRSTFTSTGQTKQLAMVDDTHFFDTVVSGFEPQNDAYKPNEPSDVYVAYGVDGGTNLRMPYNRADYYIKKTADTPGYCNPGTGTLYKGVVKHADGTFLALPLLSCVGDMQTEFELDTGNNGSMTITPILSTFTPSAISAQDIRSQLKNIRVSILTHEGGKDASFTYPAGTDIAVGRGGGQTWTPSMMAERFGADWRNYRWKVYNLYVRPKNLQGGA